MGQHKQCNIIKRLESVERDFGASVTAGEGQFENTMFLLLAVIYDVQTKVIEMLLCSAKIDYFQIDYFLEHVLEYVLTFLYRQIFEHCNIYVIYTRKSPIL